MQLHLAAGERAGELGDEKQRRVWIVLGVLRILGTEHVAGVFDDDVLPSRAAECEMALSVAGCGSKLGEYSPRIAIDASSTVSSSKKPS